MLNSNEGIGSALENHLDADELNAYAENALPAPVRARYTEHLADCRTCRTIVAQLSTSYQPIPARDRVAEQSPSSLKKFLAGLFSPFVIRYAVPAMAVVILGVTVWIFVSRQTAVEQMARKVDSPTPTQEPALKRTTSEPAADLAAAPAPKTQKPDNKPSSVSSSADAVSERPSKSTTEAVRDEFGAREDLAKTDQPKAPVAAAPETAGTAAGATTAPGSVVDRSKTSGEKKAEAEVARRENQTEERRNLEVSRSGPYNQQAPRENTAQRAEPSSGVSRQRGVARGEANEKDKASDDEAEVRSVGGHRFTKRGAIWIDGLYRANQATVNVTRGSEQYRALIGDEAGLKAIVEQLSGEVIVVWKGRAYRFR